MSENRIIRLIKQFAAGTDQRNLAMQHVERTLAANDDTPHAFITRGIQALASQHRIRPAEAHDLSCECYNSTQYTPKHIERMTVMIDLMGTSWEAIAQAAERSPRNAAKSNPYQGNNREHQETYNAAFNNKFGSAFTEAFMNDPQFKDIFNRMNGENVKTSPKPAPEPAPKERYGRTNMPPSLEGVPIIKHDENYGEGSRMIRFTMRSLRFTLLTEIIAFGNDADTIAEFAERDERLMVIITVPADMSKYPHARTKI